MKYNIIATPRSGHSAIVSWLALQDKQEKDYLGDEKGIKQFSSNSYNYSLSHTSRSMYLCPYNDLFVIDSKLREYLDKFAFGNIFIDNQSIDFCNIVGFHKSPMYADKNIIILRDFYNTFASLIRHQERNKDRHKNLQRLVRAWVSQAKEVLKITNVVPNKEVILYNSWVTSEKYRRKICKGLGLEFTDRGKDRVPHHGSGSSFDRMEKDTKADEMLVLDRWHNIRPEEYAMLDEFVTPEIVNLNRRIFGGPHIYVDKYPAWYRLYLKFLQYFRK